MNCWSLPAAFTLVLSTVACGGCTRDNPAFDPERMQDGGRDAGDGDGDWGGDWDGDGDGDPLPTTTAGDGDGDPTPTSGSTSTTGDGDRTTGDPDGCAYIQDLDGCIFTKNCEPVYYELFEDQGDRGWCLDDAVFEVCIEEIDCEQSDDDAYWCGSDLIVKTPYCVPGLVDDEGLRPCPPPVNPYPECL